MTTITIAAKTAPALSGLTAVDADAGVGINVRWVIPVDRSLHFSTEIWVATVNDRAQAVLANTVVGNTYFHPGIVGGTYYFWIRGVTVYGKSNGAFYPTGATAGVSATVKELIATPSDTGGSIFTGNNTFQNVASIDLQNLTSRTGFMNVLFNAIQNYSGAPVLTSFQIRKYNFATSAFEVFRDYGSFSEALYTPTFLYQKFQLQAVNTYRLALFWKGANNTVTLKFSQVMATWDFNSPS